MIATLIGQKIDQTQSFLQDGRRIPVTEIALSDNVVLQVKTLDKEAYLAFQLGAGSRKNPTKALQGHAKKAGASAAPLKIKEVRGVSDEELPQAGEVIKVDGVFKPGDIVQVTGVSKGKGFAGVVKRYNFRGGPKTHGQSDRHRAPGSIGQSTTPGRVYKGKRMAGRMGSDTVTVKNLLVVDVDPENKMLYVSGLIPGHRNSWVYITRTGEDKKFVPLISAEPQLSGAQQNSTDEKVEEKTEQAPEESKQEKAEEVKDGTETQPLPVATASEAVETSDEIVKTSSETVEAAEEKKTEKVDEKTKVASADSSGGPKEEKKDA